MQLDFKVEEQTLTWVNLKKVVADSVKYLTCKFTFSEDWNGITKSATFFPVEGEPFTQTLVDDWCEVPHEVIKAPLFKVSVFGGELITTNIIIINVVASGYVKGQTPKPPTPDVYAQILEKVTQTEEIAESLVDGEKTRVANEENRVKVEAERTDAENIRVDAENIRQENEQNRVYAEQQRETAVNEKLEMVQASVLQADNATYNTGAAIDRANEATKQANNATDRANKAVDDMPNTFANALKGNASGEVISLTDISPIEHNLNVKVSDVNAILKVFRKNLFKSTNYTKGTLNANTGGINTNNPTVLKYTLTTDYIYLKSGAYVVSNIDGANLRYIAFYNTNKEFKSATWTVRAKTFRFTITEDCYIRIDIERDASVAIDNFDTFCNEYQFMLELGTTKSMYELYIEPTTYTPNADGTVEGVKSIYPNMTLMADTSGVLVECEYNKDTNKVIENLVNAIISLGGNV